jgi:hypothetical protein
MRLIATSYLVGITEHPIFIYLLWIVPAELHFGKFPPHHLLNKGKVLLLTAS